MLKLLRSEFAKLKRKPLFFAAAAISALIPLGCALFLPEMQEFSSGAEAVDRLMSTLYADDSDLRPDAGSLSWRFAFDFLSGVLHFVL